MDCFEIPLDIDDVKLEAVEFTPTNEIMITVTSTGGRYSVSLLWREDYGCLWLWERDYAASFTDFREADLYSDSA